jgi:8-oxo-dGTP pyrophosphatase MutT (NUDIX family)
MRVAVRKIQDSRVTVIDPALRADGILPKPLAKSVRLSKLRKNRDCEQVAAVCYRMRNSAIEFLLVQTRNSKRWTFPKGSAEPGLTHAQAAALEAFEEAGVHGRIEETPFTEYLRSGPYYKQNSAGSTGKRLAVSAHLCEVLRLATPKESNRNRTWFSVQETRLQLRQGRKDEDGDEFARVVDSAVRRIQRLQREAGIADRPIHARLLSDRLRWNVDQNDELQRVRFEYPQIRRRFAEGRQSSVPVERVHRIEAAECEVLPFGPSRSINRSPRLLSGAKKLKALGTGSKIG